MLLARRAFLDAGHYAPLAAAISEQGGAALSSLAPELGIVDCGCGEGYFLGRMAEAPNAGLPAAPDFFLGFDTAREAVRLAASRYRVLAFVVADIGGRIPLLDGSAALLLNIFAPRNPAEFSRVLAPGGRLLVVIPGPDHLSELREALDLLSIEADKEQRLTESLDEGFRPVERSSLRFSLALGQPALTHLVQMTPNYWHLSPARRERLATLDWLSVTADFILLTFARRGQPA
jgi:23S rRNA (guanine745-N1)-methyltransferase